MSRFEPGMARWETQTEPLCYAVPTLIHTIVVHLNWHPPCLWKKFFKQASSVEEPQTPGGNKTPSQNNRESIPTSPSKKNGSCCFFQPFFSKKEQKSVRSSVFRERAFPVLFYKTAFSSVRRSRSWSRIIGGHDHLGRFVFFSPLRFQQQHHKSLSQFLGLELVQWHFYS